jgi:hypothetical protein
MTWCLSLNCIITLARTNGPSSAAILSTTHLKGTKSIKLKGLLLRFCWSLNFSRRKAPSLACSECDSTGPSNNLILEVRMWTRVFQSSRKLRRLILSYRFSSSCLKMKEVEMRRCRAVEDKRGCRFPKPFDSARRRRTAHSARETRTIKIEGNVSESTGALNMHI